MGASSLSKIPEQSVCRHTCLWISSWSSGSVLLLLEGGLGELPWQCSLGVDATDLHMVEVQPLWTTLSLLPGWESPAKSGEEGGQEEAESGSYFRL